METIINTYEDVLEYVENVDDATLVSLHNQYCRNINDSDSEIYLNDEEFFSMFFTDPLEAVRAVCYGEYNYTDEYVVFDGYANLETSNYPDKWVDHSAIAQDIMDNEHEYSYLLELEEPEEDEDD
jgi:hypothetical protein